MTDTIIANLHAMQQRIRAACEACGRDPHDVRLLLATKTVQADILRTTASAGARLFGENRVQEAMPKVEALHDCHIEWHFIGHLQTNKVRDVLSFASCIQSVDRPSLIDAIQRECEKRDRSVDVLVEVNTSGEESKAGCEPTQVDDILAALARAPRLRMRGFMTIGANTDRETVVRQCFRMLREIADRARAEGRIPADATTLSMGMSGDCEIAIAEGSTMVRVGSAVFGERRYA